MYVNKIVIISKQFLYFSSVYFKKKLAKKERFCWLFCKES
jgi:hypothetical protein